MMGNAAISRRPGRRDIWIVAVSSLEQLIGGALSTVIGVILPMLQMLQHPGLASWVQGLLGAMGLIGIGCGSIVIGNLADKRGYLGLFRLCPVIIMAGAAVCYFLTDVPFLAIGMFISGVGVGGGYSLDSAYISELMPKRWRMMMVGAAKATCSIGFIGAAVVSYFILAADPHPEIWPRMVLVIGALGLVAFLCRIDWAESPKWLMERGRIAEAKAALEHFFGPDADFASFQADSDSKVQPSKPGRFSVRQNIDRIIFSGIPWACEGLAVYGFSVFLPVLVMALGIEKAGITGIPRIENSVEVTALVNFFILPGFVIGLVLVSRVSSVKLMSTGFIFSAVGLGVLLASYLLHWPAWVMIAGFVVFEVALNAGPHLVTYIIPARIYPVADRGAGSGIAALFGKVGAVAGVMLMPMLLHWGGMSLVLTVSGAVMLIGAAVTIVYGRKLMG